MFWFGLVRRWTRRWGWTRPLWRSASAKGPGVWSARRRPRLPPWGPTLAPPTLIIPPTLIPPPPPPQPRRRAPAVATARTTVRK
eukprot:1162462-Prorocentrum_minimum.AAC.3